jgi:hypothetical protein
MRRTRCWGEVDFSSGEFGIEPVEDDTDAVWFGYDPESEKTRRVETS